MKLFVFTAVLTGMISAANAGTVYVSATGSGDQSGSDPDNACAGIAAGYAKANANDTIQLAADTYSFAAGGQIALEKAGLIVQGDVDHPENVILDGGGNNVGFFSLTKAATLRGMTMRNANAASGLQAVNIVKSVNVCIDACVFSGLTNAAAGAAIATAQAATVIVSNSTFSACATTSETSSVNGGAVSVNQSNAKAYYYNCDFIKCSAGYGAGAICGYTRIEGCTFDSCTAKMGGGGALAKNVLANPVISDCTFTGNSLTDSAAGYSGGAIWLATDTVLEGCRFYTNWSSRTAGAVYVAGGESKLYRCKFYGNEAASGYGAVSGVSTVEDCVFSGNRTIGSDAGAFGATYAKGPTSILRTSFFANSAPLGKGGAIYANGKTNIVVDACSFVCNSNYFNSAGGAGIYLNEGFLTLRNSLFAKNWHGHKGASAVEINTAKSYSAVVENCTFVSNVVDSTDGKVAGHAVLTQSAAFAVTNCLFFSNFDVYGNKVCNFYKSQVLDRFAYCASDDDKLIELDHCFTLTESPFVGNDDYSLAVNSAPIDRGLKLPWMTRGVCDLAGKVRVSGIAPDLGAYEYFFRPGFMVIVR